MHTNKNAPADFVSVSGPPRQNAASIRSPSALVGLGLAGLLSAGLPGLAAAQDAPKPTYDFAGYVDAAYTHLSEGGLFPNGFTLLGPNRVFDNQPDAFMLNQAALFANINAKEKFSAFVNLTAGSDANVIKSFGSSTDQFDVTQAYVRFQSGNTTFIAGKFVTLAGAEVIDSRSMPVYSRSILFGYAHPTTGGEPVRVSRLQVPGRTNSPARGHSSPHGSARRSRSRDWHRYPRKCGAR